MSRPKTTRKRRYTPCGRQFERDEPRPAVRPGPMSPDPARSRCPPVTARGRKRSPAFHRHFIGPGFWLARGL